jgi:hypothetical protein
MSSGTAVAFSSRLLDAFRGPWRRTSKAPQSSTLALRDAGFQRKCGLIAQADDKGNEQRCALQEIR